MTQPNIYFGVPPPASLHELSKTKENLFTSQSFR